MGQQELKVLVCEVVNPKDGPQLYVSGTRCAVEYIPHGSCCDTGKGVVTKCKAFVLACALVIGTRV